jgi:geranylgeranyl diphosphate synthase type I
VTGKPVGNDLREGKRTLVLHEAWLRADDSQRETLQAVVGNPNAGEKQVADATSIVVELGAVEIVRERAMKLIRNALPKLEQLQPSHWRDLLGLWADFMIQRQV